MTPTTQSVGRQQRTRLVIVHDSVGGTTGMGRVAAAMVRTGQECGWDVTLVGIDIDGAFPDVRQIPVGWPARVPSVVARLLWAATVSLRLRNEDLSDALVHVHAPLLMRQADLFTCHHLAEGAARRGSRESLRGIEGALRRAQQIVGTKLDSLAYRWRPCDTRVTFVSAFLKDEFTALYGPPTGGEILPPPSPPWDPISDRERVAARARYGVREGESVVGYFGGNDPRKGVSQVLRLADESDYVVLGAGPRSEHLKFGGRAGLGYVNVRDVLAACDVVVAPTLFDAAPVAVLEAVAVGLPVVTGVNSGWAAPLAQFGAGASCRADEALAGVIETVIPGSPESAKAFTQYYSYENLSTKLTELWESMR